MTEVTNMPKLGQPPNSGKGTRMKHAILTFTFAAAVLAGTAQAAGDPRICNTPNTSAGSSKHAYRCAQTAAVNLTRTTMARQQHVPRWLSPTYCDESGSLL